MNLNFGSPFGFLFPAVLIAAPLLVGALIYAYLRRGQGTRIPVATLLILRDLQRSSTSRKIFAPPFRFFFELLLLTILLLGAAGLFREGGNEQTAVIIDNSFSMAAIDPSAVTGETLIESARGQARRMTRSMSSRARVEIFASSPVLGSITEGLTAPSAAAEQISKVKPVCSGDNLETALARLSADTGYSRVAVFTGRPIADREGRNAAASGRDRRFELQSMVPPQRESLMQNVAISDIHLRRSSGAGRRYDLSVQVEAYTLQPVEISLSVAAISSALNPDDSQVLSERRMKLSAGAGEAVVFRDLSGSAEAYTAKLRAEGASAKLDLIKEDNQAWVVAEEDAAKALLVGELTPKDLGLDKLHAASFEHVTPAQYESGTLQEPQSRYRVLLFHHYLPAQLPHESSFFIMPPPGNKLIPASSQVLDAKLTRWLPAHPIVSYLNLAALELKLVTPLAVPAWAEEVIASTAGAVVAAGEQGQARFVAVGFEIFPYEGLHSPVISIFTLNALNWLSAGRLNTGYQNAGSSLIQPADALSARYVGGAEIFRRGSTPGKEQVSLMDVGLVQILEEKGKASLVAVNYFDAQESNLLLAAPLRAPPSRAGGRDIRQKDLWVRALALTALALCCLELLALFYPAFARILKRGKNTNIHAAL